MISPNPNRILVVLLSRTTNYIIDIDSSVSLESHVVHQQSSDLDLPILSWPFTTVIFHCGIQLALTSHYMYVGSLT